MAIQRNPYEQGGIVGPNAQGLLDSLRGPTAQVGSTPAEHRALGTAAGHDMSWMDQPGEVSVPPMQADAPMAPAAPNYKQTGQYLGNRFKNEKSQRPWEDQSERYQIGTVLSNFDPKQGITADLIAALNGADIHGAKFSGSGDKLTVENAGGWDRFGTGGTDDIIGNFKSGNGEWAAWTSPEGQAKQRAINAQRRGQLPAQAAPQAGLGGINGMLQGNAVGNIQQALSSIQEPGMLQQLIAALGGQ
jgi:hypothetical protein